MIKLINISLILFIFYNKSLISNNSSNCLDVLNMKYTNSKQYIKLVDSFNNFIHSKKYIYDNVLIKDDKNIEYDYSNSMKEKILIHKSITMDSNYSKALFKLVVYDTIVHKVQYFYNVKAFYKSGNWEFYFERQSYFLSIKFNELYLKNKEMDKSQLNELMNNILSNNSLEYFDEDCNIIKPLPVNFINLDSNIIESNKLTRDFIDF